MDGWIHACKGGWIDEWLEEGMKALKIHKDNNIYIGK